MRRLVGRWVWRAVIMAVGTAAGTGGCLGRAQQELEVLFRTEANLDLIDDSVLVDVFGPEILELFN